MKLTEQQSKLYHSHTLRNKTEIENSSKCGCICCCRIYLPNEVEDYISDGDGKTALCPYCGTDAIVGEGCGLEINQEILNALNKRWF